MYAQLFTAALFLTARVEPAQLSISWWQEEQKMAYLYNGASLALDRNEAPTGQNVGELWKPDAEWQPGTEGHTACDCWHDIPESAGPQREGDWWLPTDGALRMQEMKGDS